MNFINKSLEKLADKKVERKARAAATRVEIARIRGEPLDYFEIPIGWRPLGTPAQKYAERVGYLTVAKLDVLGIEGVTYDAKATKRTSQQVCSAGMGVFDTDGRVIIPNEISAPDTRMMGRLTLVLVGDEQAG